MRTRRRRKLVRRILNEVGSERGIADADIIVAGGRGMGSEENFRLIYELAELLGAAVGKNYAAVTTWLKKRLPALAAAFLATAAADLYFTYRSQVHGEVFRWFEALHLCYCLAAIFFLFALFAKFCERIDRLPAFVTLCDRSSYLIYLSHILPIYIANDLIARAGIADMLAAYLCRFAFTYLVTFAGCLLYTLLKEKCKERLCHANR